ncbi:MAG TPA: hypothetical protein VHG51_13300, partial [Longimicrobiaceae bacterium]|nr:hypothetical protein [Longimicrobiaceae bacterium]
GADPAGLPSTPAASAAAAQSREAEAPPAGGGPGEPARYPGEGTDYLIAPRAYRAVGAQPYERRPGDPVYRPLRIFTLDPAASQLDGAVALVNVPYEPVEPGPRGRLFEVDGTDGVLGVRYRSVDLDDPHVLIGSGRDPSPTDPEFHQQMVYAVCSMVYAAFKLALGRDVAWGFEADGPPGEPLRLRLRPHGSGERNAEYDRVRGTISFGYYRADPAVLGRNLPGGWVFTCLSHDVVVHEVTHALLDGLRAHFVHPSGLDVLAFHEAFADLVAVFQHFSYDRVVEAAIGRSRGDLRDASLLTDLATQFGHTVGAGRALRSAIDTRSLRHGGDAGGADALPPQYGEATEPHERGSVLTAAVFEAFLTVFERRTRRFLRLATGGTGVLPGGEMPADLRALLAEEASKLASHFLTICIRAIDYCPPVDLEFGEFLRAVVTADRDLVPDDRWRYREAWIDAFRRRGIHPSGVQSLSEDALLWRAPHRPIADEAELSFARLRFAGDPGRAAGREELHRQGAMLGRLVCEERHRHEFGLARQGDPELDGDAVDLPVVESIRSSRRVGPDGQVVFDLVAEVTQRRVVRAGGRTASFYGGSTVILDPRGSIRYVISKSVRSRERAERLREFLGSDQGRRYWAERDGELRPHGHPFRLLHGATPG